MKGLMFWTGKFLLNVKRHFRIKKSSPKSDFVFFFDNPGTTKVWTISGYKLSTDYPFHSAQVDVLIFWALIKHNQTNKQISTVFQIILILQILLITEANSNLRKDLDRNLPFSFLRFLSTFLGVLRYSYDVTETFQAKFSLSLPPMSNCNRKLGVFESLTHNVS